MCSASHRNRTDEKTRFYQDLHQGKGFKPTRAQTVHQMCLQITFLIKLGLRQTKWVKNMCKSVTAVGKKLYLFLFKKNFFNEKLITITHFPLSKTFHSTYADKTDSLRHGFPTTANHHTQNLSSHSHTTHSQLMRILPSPAQHKPQRNQVYRLLPLIPVPQSTSLYNLFS